ncbi:MAG: hypothetical protein EA339_13470 [Rhodobacteraceae bacterium]|nr:MAG: hypothetical protein EA339_13470 [Paracoccaceae bacterium]
MQTQGRITLTPQSSVDEQIRDLEAFLEEISPDPAPIPAPPSAPIRDRQADLRRAKALIDEAIDLLRPHFTGS